MPKKKDEIETTPLYDRLHNRLWPISSCKLHRYLNTKTGKTRHTREYNDREYGGQEDA